MTKGVLELALIRQNLINSGKIIYASPNGNQYKEEICGICGESEGFYFKNETDEWLTCINCGRSG